MATNYPHLTDTESVRREAESQYGGLSDAAAFTAAHRATRDPNVEAAALRHRNADETAKVQNDLSLAQKKIDAEYGDGTYRVLDAAVRGDALSAIVEDQYGRPSHVVVGWTDQWRSITPTGPDAEARANANAEAAKGRLGAEARAEVQRLVSEATAGVLSKVNDLLGGKLGDVDQIREDAVRDAMADDADDAARLAAINAGLKVPDAGGASQERGSGPRTKRGSGPRTKGSPSSTEGNDTSESGAGKTQGTETNSGSGDDDAEGTWPRRHDSLDEIADEHGVSFDALGSRPSVADKIAALEAAGVNPPADEE